MNGLLSLGVTRLPWQALTASPNSLLIACFTSAILLLAMTDILLPRGDAVGVGGVLDVVALIIIGPLPAAACVVVGVTLAYLFRRGVSVGGWAATLGARVAGLAGAFAVGAVASVRAPVSAPAAWGSVAVAIAVYLAVELLVTQALTAGRTGRSFPRLVRGNIDRQASVLAAQGSAAVLAVMVFESMSAWGLVLVSALLLLIRQSYSMLLEVGDTYRSTVEVLVQASEGVQSDRLGHAERTAGIAREIAAGCRLAPRELERISYAALLHDIGMVGQVDGQAGTACQSSKVLDGVHFFEGVIGILRLLDGRVLDVVATRDDYLAAFIVALSDDADAVMNPRVHCNRVNSATDRVAPLVPPALKAQAVSAAVRIGLPIPAVS